MCRLLCISYLIFFAILAAYSLSYDNDTKLDFIWTKAKGDVYYYNIYVSKDSREYVFEDTTKTNSYTLTGKYGHRYKIKVQAVDAAGNLSPMSEESDWVICDTKPPWDINDDGCVDKSDLEMIVNTFGETENNLKTDINYDGKVDIFDLVLVGSNFLEEKATTSIHNISLLQQLYDILKKTSNPTSNLKLALFELEKLLLPDETELLQNYPNPFNLETWIPFKLANRTMVTISIYDASGSIVCILELGERTVGVYVSKGRAAYWDGRNRDCEEVSSGLYFYHLKAGDFEETRRMIILK